MMVTCRALSLIFYTVVLFSWLAITPCFAAGRKCRDIPTGPLGAETKVGKPINEVVEALLHDAETIYAEASRIVKRKPRTEAQSFALSEENFLISECHFQNTFSSASKTNTELPEKMQWTLIRIEQFDNFIFGAVNQAVGCSNTEAGVRLKVSRELLDHAWMEFEGNIKQRDWDPNLDWPETHERCR
jgi:hypothetical protein